MAIESAMNGEESRGDGHENDLVMPGFRFHPTEEELIDFYLRRKVEGKRFNVELITFLDLYSYDPWELPALAIIGDKEWFFYVPRDRKYRNGDRPNRVTPTGYWKATGADRMIRAENNRQVGLKKTLVFYSGKAPKGIRSTWIMNEYRLPKSETDLYQKAEISLCRVYKRSGNDDYSQLTSTLSAKASTSRGSLANRKHLTSHHQVVNFAIHDQGENSSLKIPEIAVGSKTNLPTSMLPKPKVYRSTASVASLSSTTTTEEDGLSFYHSTNTSGLIPPYSLLNLSTSTMTSTPIDELNKIVGYDQTYNNQPNHFHSLTPQSQLLPFNSLPVSFSTVSDKLWDWNPLPDVGRDYTSFK
ncbi:NAC domain-containing protein 35-like [Ananas comosus]|uniref:NAC domain-containing protein 35-like n=1 Tax=Ananas comosus TaxID=4615 RepID=A0A6P5F3T7_ANACO|nr:NAC domain-containing protein 35-like [Ananas comosus]